MKHLLSILCLFIFSCDSGGDEETLSPFVGTWIIENQTYSYSEGCVDYPDEEEVWDNIHYIVNGNGTWLIEYIDEEDIIITGTWNEDVSQYYIDICFDDPECESYYQEGEEGCSEGAHYTCMDHVSDCTWENEEEPCRILNAVFSQNNQSFTHVFEEEEDDGCIETTTRTYERVD